jgi:hypothetical protein
LQKTRDMMLGSPDWIALCPDVVDSLGDWLKKVSDVRKLPEQIRHKFLAIILDLVRHFPYFLSIILSILQMPGITQAISNYTDAGNRVKEAIQALRTLDEDKDICDQIFAGQISYLNF